MFTIKQSSSETPEFLNFLPLMINFLIHFQTKKKHNACIANIAFRHSWKSYVNSIWAILPRLEGQNIFSLWGKSTALSLGPLGAEADLNKK